MKTRIRHLWLVLITLPGLLFSQERRWLLVEMQVFCRRLPEVMKRPLPDALHEVTPHSPPRPNIPPDTIRQLADLAALLDRRSPLGLCLRRSLTRYHYLRPDVPVRVHFGARLVGRVRNPPGKITGHAWLTLNGRPYYEAEENWRDFTVMLTWPDAGEQ